MPRKGKKGNQVSQNKQAIGRTLPSPDLPRPLLRLIERQWDLMQHIGDGSVAKSWSTPPPNKCNPVAHTLPYRRRNAQKNQTSLPQLRLAMVTHGGNDQSNINGASTSKYLFILPIRRQWHFGSKHNFYCINNRDLKWEKHECRIVDPHDSGQQPMQFTSVIGFAGRFYALSLQGTLAVIEEDMDFRPTITYVSSSRAVPSVPWRHFRECLVKSEGEILLVFLISAGKSVNVTDHVEVFRLELQRLSWSKMDSLGERTLFLGSNCCMEVTASRVGCRRNCVYFTQQRATAGDNDGWWVFDMEGGGISPDDSFDKSLAWVEY